MGSWDIKDHLYSSQTQYLSGSISAIVDTKMWGTSRMGLSSTVKLPAAWRRRCSGGPANDERWQTKCGKGRQIRGSRHVPARLGYQGFRCFCFLRLLPLNSNSRTTHHFVYLPWETAAEIMTVTLMSTYTTVPTLFSFALLVGCSQTLTPPLTSTDQGAST